MNRLLSHSKVSWMDQCLKILAIPLFCFIVSCSPSSRPVPLTSYADPMVGTGGHGHTYPGATVPFGAVQLSPNNGINGWDWCSGYNYSDSIIVGFSHTHLSGTGIGDLGDILMMPAGRQVDLTAPAEDRNQLPFRSSFSHDQENAYPGFYEVYLPENKVKVELTTSRRVGFHRYVFDQPAKPHVVIDLGFAINWDKAVATSFKVENDSTISGFRHSKGWAKDQRLFFTIKFSEPFLSAQFYDSTRLVTGEVTNGIKSRALVEFNASHRVLMAKVGISSASVEGAKKSLDEIENWDFDVVKTKAVKAWENELEKIVVTSGNSKLKRTFYSALYHTALAPVIYSDANNEYKGADGEIHTAPNYTKYDILSLWDTFRAANPLFTIIRNDRVDDIINSMLSHYREYGLLPVWSLLGNETNTMTGYHAIPVIADAYLKGYTGFDIEVAYAAMKKSADQDIRGVQFLKEYGYIPSDLEVESVTKTLEYAYDDWCIAQVAQKLDKGEDYEYFMKRANSYKHLFDPETGFMRGKMSDGLWREPFDPKFSSHRVNTDYTEGNAWQHSWFVPHDVKGLIDLMGGNEAFIKKLDRLFEEDSEITGENASVDISGLIGQYAHGNEPSHHIAYLYTYAGAPWKTQERVRQILLTQYDDTPLGLCGNEDCGQMSAWYVFSALGLYPVNPAEGIYVFGSPLFEKAEIDVGDGKRFTIEAPGVSDKNIYIGSILLNGQPYDKTYLAHQDMINGGTLTFNMSDQPNKSRGIVPETLPPSMSNQ